MRIIQNCPICNIKLKHISPAKFEHITYCPKCNYVNHYINQQTIEYIGNKQIILNNKLFFSDFNRYIKKWYGIVLIAGRNYRKYKKKTKLPDNIKEFIKQN